MDWSWLDPLCIDLKSYLKIVYRAAKETEILGGSLESSKNTHYETFNVVFHVFSHKHTSVMLPVGFDALNHCTGKTEGGQILWV